MEKKVPPEVLARIAILRAQRAAEETLGNQDPQADDPRPRRKPKSKPGRTKSPGTQ